MNRVILTQPEPRCIELAARLRARGHEVASLPLRRLQRLPQAPTPDELLAKLPGSYDWVVFVSPGAIAIAFGDDPAAVHAWPPQVGLAVVGPGSAAALAELGLAPPSIQLVLPPVAPYDAQALLGEPPFDAPAGLRILVLRGEQGRDDWLDALRARGATVERLALYRSQSRAPDPAALSALRQWAREDCAAVFHFTSAEVVHELDRLLEEAGLAGWARRQSALTVHPRILSALEALGWQRTQVIEPGEPALAAGIESA